MVCFHRAVWSPVGHGDEGGATDGHQSWSFISSSSVWSVCCSHCVHPPGDGGSVCIPPRPSPSLVSLCSGLESIHSLFFFSSPFITFYFLCRVEFQNKFYSGTGVKFCPFTFSALPSSFESDGLLWKDWIYWQLMNGAKAGQFCAATTSQCDFWWLFLPFKQFCEFLKAQTLPPQQDHKDKTELVCSKWMYFLPGWRWLQTRMQLNYNTFWYFHIHIWKVIFYFMISVLDNRGAWKYFCTKTVWKVLFEV